MSNSFVTRVTRGLFVVGALAPFAAGQTQMEDEKLLASDGSASDTFGKAVSVDGEFAVIGSPLDSHSGTASGSAYVFRRMGNHWQQVQKLVPPGAAPGDSFGIDVAIAGDRLVVGANSDDDMGGSSGSAFVYRLNSSDSWTLEKKLVASDGSAFDQFGTRVAIDGDRVVVGAPGKDNANFNGGGAYVFERSGSTWNQMEIIMPSTLGAADGFGSAIAIDGDRIAFGVYRDDTAGSNAGAVYMYRRLSATNWTQEAKLTATQANDFDYMGYSVDIDGDRVVAGAYRFDNGGTDAGAAFVFERQWGSNWKQVGTLLAGDRTSGDNMGQAVQIQGDMVLTGAHGNSHAGSQSGAAYVFARGANGAWNQSSKIVASDAAEKDHFGRYLSLHNGRALVGAAFDDDQGTSSGSVYALELGTLIADVSSVSILLGTPQELTLRAGSSWGGRPYAFLGSITGTDGIALGGGTELPLTDDLYTLWGALNGLPIAGWAGQLDGSGRANATYRVPQGTPTALAGLTLYHAYLAVDPATGAVMASNAASVTLTP